ncbi:hypothetical protein M422DRAFT_258443 [Sphaerobolus stellatus SS14]|uniref:RRM domain-containing protein n=1 Tax=Sphaerobolus stellatus (strain SS14) TaxID=990650 RepID=A0A0C9VBA6_SPHS4|nr:hypothetical protein M422DRAFT_258443 [Sphaerobolus stellatus SS14]
MYINGRPPHFKAEQLYALASQFSSDLSSRTFTRQLGYGFVLFDIVDAAQKCIDILHSHHNLHPKFAKVSHSFHPVLSHLTLPHLSFPFDPIVIPRYHQTPLTPLSFSLIKSKLTKSRARRPSSTERTRTRPPPLTSPNSRSRIIPLLRILALARRLRIQLACRWVLVAVGGGTMGGEEAGGDVILRGPIILPTPITPQDKLKLKLKPKAHRHVSRHIHCASDALAARYQQQRRRQRERP